MRSAFLTGIAATVAAAGCDAARRTTVAHGEESSIIILAADSLWAEVGDSVLATLEPRVFTVRDEKMFEATYVSPLSEDWLKLRGFRQVLAIGRAGDGWVSPALERVAPPAARPGLVEAPDVWARSQTVTVLLLPDDGTADALYPLLPVLGERLDARYRAYVRNRMFMSDANTELRDTLRSQAGFSIVLPRIYGGDVMDSLYVFRNRAELGSELIRTILVTWREGAITLDAESVLGWRDALTPRVYEPQLTERERLEVQPLEDRGAGALQVQGIWRGADPAFPSAGPFLDRVIPCPAQARTYFLEAWLYAPGRPKYEYMIQMETLLDSFECGPFGG
jgi:hypothetical protein